ncbi:MAG: alpha-amylase family glycosyl hydrolase [Bacteroidales bacterium]
MIRTIFLAVISIFIIYGCNTNESITDSNSHIFGVPDPIRLTPGEYTINLNDFFKEPNAIDSVRFHESIEYTFVNDDKIELEINDKQLPYLSEMKVWVENSDYSLVLIKSLKTPYTFSFETDKDYEKVELAGSFNDWTPGNTPLKKEDGAWKTTLNLNPGKYQYQVVADGEWMLDPNNKEKEDNNQGGYNSILKIEKSREKEKPRLFAEKINESVVEIEARHNPEKVFALWQNELLEIEQDDNKIFVTIPSKAKNAKRSKLRVYSYNDAGISNDILLPLEDGNIIEDAKQLSRKDKHYNIMYFIMVDRFNNGNPDNDEPLDDPKVHDKANYHGGDLEGIYQKINDGYLTDLGFNSVWVTPITQNPKKAYKEYPQPRRWYSGYHGYWPVTLTTVDHRFGDAAAMQKLVDEAHNNDMNLILDFVSNHVHEKNKLYKENPDWATEMILPNGDTNIRIWDEQRLTTWFDTFLPTLDLRKPEVIETMSDSALFWLKEYDIDGFRHDATKHIPQEYWRTLTHKMRKDVENHNEILQIGETFGSRELIGDYVGNGQLDGQFDFNLYFDARSVFAQDDVSFTVLEESLKESFSYYGWHSLMGNITGNHDIPRFISFAGGALDFDEDAKEAGWNRDIEVEDPTGYAKLSSLTAFIMTIPGIPVVYYGDEIGMPGAGDPDNRRDMRFENLTKHEKETRETAKKLVTLRRNNIELVYGDFKFLESTDETFVYARKYFDNVSIVAFNKGSKQEEVTFDINNFVSESDLEENFESEWSIKNGEMTITLKPYSFDIINN